jgi:hypothetical protein
MKHYYFVFVLLLFLNSCKDQETSSRLVESDPDPMSPAAMVRIPVNEYGVPDTSKIAKIEFDEPTFHFGTVNEGEIVEHEFHFTNTGKVALLISDAKATCGCTIPEIPKEAIPPGERGSMMARFNTKSKEGQQTKTISVMANTLPSVTKIHFTGEVIPKSK